MNSFTIKMADVLEWIDLKGKNGIASGNLKAVKVNWKWLEVLRFFIVWSYAVVGIGLEENVNETWTPGADDFKEVVTKRSGKVLKTKRNPAKKAKVSLFKSKESDYHMAMALSVSEEIEKERRAENNLQEDLAKALSLSLSEREEQVEVDQAVGDDDNTVIER